jgi:hypothetical protein
MVDLGRIDMRGSFYRDNVARIDGQYRLHRGAEIADVYGLRAWHQGVFGGIRALERKTKQYR